jgi:hypothetical protein
MLAVHAYDRSQGSDPSLATAIVAEIGALPSEKGLDPVVWLGVVPRQYSTGSKAKRLDNSKRGSQRSRTHEGCEDRHQVDHCGLGCAT